MPLSPSELILNPDKSIYHLNLMPEDIANTIITVGDPERVADISKYFDTLEVKKGKREFHTHTGTLNGKRLTVISTGIGTDNIDIVLNELDALVNIDFETRTVKPETIVLDIIRVGTSGAIQADIPVDSILLSEYAIGLDSLLHFYDGEHIQHPKIQLAFVDHMDWSVYKSIPYVVQCDTSLMNKFDTENVQLGFTATNVGFYGPQGRSLRLKTQDEDLNSKLNTFDYKGFRITNLEMETSGIYALCKLLGHRAISLNCILANRSTGEFSADPGKAVEILIQHTLRTLTQ